MWMYTPGSSLKLIINLFTFVYMYIYVVNIVFILCIGKEKFGQGVKIAQYSARLVTERL